MRHSTLTPACPSCRAEIEDTKHLIENCAEYREERNNIKSFLDKTLGETTKRYNLEEIALGEKRYDEELKK